MEGELPTELDPRLLRGLELLDRGEHHDAHEALEELWSGEVGATRRLLQALIQLAVALHHRGLGNHGGALALLERALDHLRAVKAPTCFLDPRELQGSIEALRAELRVERERGEPRFDPAMVPRFDAVRARIREERRKRGLPEVGDDVSRSSRA